MGTDNSNFDFGFSLYIIACNNIVVPFCEWPNLVHFCGANAKPFQNLPL